MRERVIAAGGDLDIADEAGTSVTITFPAGAHT
jgi:signal transduction histidine kinase